MIHVGFTGTQRGMNEKQAANVFELLRYLPEFIGHHGDCIGADAQFDALARACSGFRWMVIHPPDVDVKRAFCGDTARDIFMPPKPYLVRNQDIVDESSRLIVAPKEDYQTLRSGTWSTYRRAVAVNAAYPNPTAMTKSIAICLPFGGVMYEGAPV